MISLIVEITGDEDKINSFVEVLRPFGILRNGADRPGGDGTRRIAGLTCPERIWQWCTCAGRINGEVGYRLKNTKINGFFQCKFIHFKE